MTHAASRRRGLSRDEPHNRLFDVLLDVIGGGFLGVAADFSAKNDRVRFRVFVEQFERVEEVGADDRIAADADRRRLANAAHRQLVDRLVGQRARAGDDADPAGQKNSGRHNADLALAGRDDAGAVRPDQARVAALHEAPRLDHVARGNAFGDADDQRHPGIDGFHDGISRKRRRNEDDGCVGAGFFHGFANRVEDGPAFVGGAALARGDACDDLGAVIGAGLGVERAFASGEALHHESGFFVDQYAHG